MRIRSLMVLASTVIATTAVAQTATIPWSVDGTIADDDSREEEESRYDEHRLRLDAGQRYKITATSDAFDPRIRLSRSGSTDPVAENDDYGGSLNSQINYTPTESGEYVLRVLPYASDGRGAYRAAAEIQPPLPAPVRPGDRAASRSRWQIWEGELTGADPERDGSRFDDYLITMRQGQTRLVMAETESFDPVVSILPAADREGEEIDFDDDAGPGTAALLGFRAPQDGDYIIRVRSLGPDGRGRYRVRVSDALTPPPPLGYGVDDESGDHEGH